MHIIRPAVLQIIWEVCKPRYDSQPDILIYQLWTVVFGIIDSVYTHEPER